MFFKRGNFHENNHKITKKEIIIKIPKNNLKREKHLEIIIPYNFY